MRIYVVRYIIPGGEGKVCLCEGLQEVMKTVTAEGEEPTKTLFIRMERPINVPVDLTGFGLGLNEVVIEAIEVPANLVYETQEIECVRRPTRDAFPASDAGYELSAN